MFKKGGWYKTLLINIVPPSLLDCLIQLLEIKVVYRAASFFVVEVVQPHIRFLHLFGSIINGLFIRIIGEISALAVFTIYQLD